MATRSNGPFKSSASSAASTIVKTTGDTGFSAAVGDLVMVTLCANNTSVTFGCSDSAGNTWNLETQIININVMLVVAWCQVTVAIPTNGSITITHASLSRRVTSVQKITGITGVVTRDQRITGTGTTSPMAVGPTGTLAEAIECCFAIHGVQDSGTPTTYSDATSGWTNLGTMGSSGGTVSSVTLGMSYRETAATTALSDSATQTGTIDRRASMLLTFKGIAGSARLPRHGFVNHSNPGIA